VVRIAHAHDDGALDLILTHLSHKAELHEFQKRLCGRPLWRRWYEVAHDVADHSLRCTFGLKLHQATADAQRHLDQAIQPDACKERQSRLQAFKIHITESPDDATR
jgi:hypothetical protein